MSGASGLGSKVSCCDGPPDWKMKTTDRAFRPGRRGDGPGLQPEQVREAHAEQAQAAGPEQLAAGDPGMIFLAAAGLNHGSILASQPFTAAFHLTTSIGTLEDVAAGVVIRPRLDSFRGDPERLPGQPPVGRSMDQAAGVTVRVADVGSQQVAGEEEGAVTSAR